MKLISKLDIDLTWPQGILDEVLLPNRLQPGAVFETILSGRANEELAEYLVGLRALNAYPCLVKLPDSVKSKLTVERLKGVLVNGKKHPLCTR